MKNMQISVLAAALMLASSSAWAGVACQTDDGLGNVNTAGATANGVDATACGPNATANGFGSVAVGSGVAVGVGVGREAALTSPLSVPYCAG